MLKAEIDRFEKSLIPKTRDELMSITVDIYIQYVELASRMKEEEKSNHEMFEMFNRMKNELEDARKELGELREQNRHLTGITTLQTQKMFGRSSEKARKPKKQMYSRFPGSQSLFISRLKNKGGAAMKGRCQGRNISQNSHSVKSMSMT